MKDAIVLKTPEEIKIYSDPYRLKIFGYFQTMAHPATVKEIADMMEEVPAKVYYHVKKLESIGLLKLVETREIKGIIAKYYEAFSGDINIGIKEMDPSLKKVSLNATQTLINNFYDMNKQNFLKNMGLDGEESRKGTLRATELYMTQEEVESLQSELFQLLDRYQNKRTEPGIGTYTAFFSMIQDYSANQNKKHVASKDAEPSAE